MNLPDQCGYHWLRFDEDFATSDRRREKLPAPQSAAKSQRSSRRPSGRRGTERRQTSNRSSTARRIIRVGWVIRRGRTRATPAGLARRTSSGDPAVNDETPARRCASLGEFPFGDFESPAAGNCDFIGQQILKPRCQRQFRRRSSRAAPPPPAPHKRPPSPRRPFRSVPPASRVYSAGVSFAAGDLFWREFVCGLDRSRIGWPSGLLLRRMNKLLRSCAPGGLEFTHQERRQQTARHARHHNHPFERSAPRRRCRQSSS